MQTWRRGRSILYLVCLLLLEYDYKRYSQHNLNLHNIFLKENKEYKKDILWMKLLMANFNHSGSSRLVMSSTIYGANRKRRVAAVEAEAQEQVRCSHLTRSVSRFLNMIQTMQRKTMLILASWLAEMRLRREKSNSEMGKC